VNAHRTLTKWDIDVKGCGHGMSVTEGAVDVRSGQQDIQVLQLPRPQSWAISYLRRAALADYLCALGGATAAAQLRFGGFAHLPPGYTILTAAFPALWCVSMLLAGVYDTRFIGIGSDEFRRAFNAALCVAAGVIAVSYLARLDLSRGYVGIALPAATVADLAVRYRLRKHLHARRARGWYTQRVVAVGHAAAVADLVTTLRRESYHGLTVVAACLAGPAITAHVADVPVAGTLAGVPATVKEFGADAVAVLACSEMDTDRLRELAWELEKTGTDLCVAPTLLDVAGPRTTIRPVAGLPLLYVDHPDLSGGKQVLKGVFDRTAAGCALVLLAPLFAVIALAIRCVDHGPVLFRQIRVGGNGRVFTVYKFRTMRVDADLAKARLVAANEASGVLFKIRRDRGSPGPAGGCGAGRSTNCRSS